MKIPMFGFNRHRLKMDDYYHTEVAFMKVMQKWKDQNHNIFDMAVFGTKHGSQPADYLSERELKIVASIIQWLGTPVGQNFLKEVKELDEVLESLTNIKA
jgi:hypothetical protein